MTIKLKCTSYFPVAPVILPQRVYICIPLTLESEHSILKYNHSNLSYVAVLLWFNVYYAVKGVSYFLTIQIKGTGQCFPVVLFIMLYKVVVTFVSLNEILKCDHANESY